MSAYLYDEAIVNAFRDWVGDQNITIEAPDRLFSYRARTATTKDAVVLPVVSLERVGVQIVNTSRTPLSADGIIKEVKENKLFKLRAVPIRLNYQLDVYTRYRKECDNLMREFIFKLINNPTLIIEIPYGGSTYTHKFNIRIGEEVIDNSDIMQHFETGEYFRQTLEIYIDDAYMFSYNSKEALEINPNEIAVEIREKEN